MELSSNWKKLQATLSDDKNQSQRQNTTQLKRKRTYESLRPRKIQKSIHKTSQPADRSENQFKSRKRMGSFLSTTAADATASDPPVDNVQPRRSIDSLEASKYRYIAMDCEMVGTDSVTPTAIKAKSFNPSNNHTKSDFSILARVTLVSYTLEVIYDEYVRPPEGVKISDYRTRFSGITAEHLDPMNEITKPIEFTRAQSDVARLLKHKILVGHAVTNDLRVLGLDHPRRAIRDTAKHVPYRKSAVGGTQLGTTRREGRNAYRSGDPALRILAKEILGWDIQAGSQGHDSAEDAKAAMELFKRDKTSFEDAAAAIFGRPSTETSHKSSDRDTDRLDHEENQDQHKQRVQGRSRKEKKQGKYR